MLSNGQFRKLLNDATILLRDMAGDAATNVAGKVNPSEDKLKQIDQPAEDNTWHDVPDLSKDSIKKQASDVYNKNKPFNRDQAAAAAQSGAENQDAAATTDQLQSQAQANVPDETQENVKKAQSAVAQNTKNYISKKMPQERRDQTIWRLKKMVTEIQGHSDCKSATRS